MKPWVTYTVGSIAIAAMLAGGILLLRYKRSRTASYACTSLEISFCEPYRFISEEEVDELLVEKMLPYVGQRMDGIDINGYERALRLNPFVEKAEVWMTSDGTVHASVDQKEAVARVRNSAGSFYIDSDSEPFPLSAGYDAPVRLYEGCVDLTAGDLGEIGRFNRALESQQVWKSLIDSVHVESGAHFSFRVDGVTFNFGTCRNASEKFSKLDRYRESIAPLGKGEKTVDLQYKGQIICK